MGKKNCDHDPVAHLNRMRPIGWYSQMGSRLTDPYAKWGACPDCDEKCIWLDGVPTAIHKGGIEEDDDDE